MQGRDHGQVQMKGIVPPRCFPCCIVWTPLPILAWLFPIIGHAGIGMSDGTILDFAGPYLVNDQGLAFGNPTWYIHLDLFKADELKGLGSDAVLEQYDACLRRARYVYERQFYHIGNNCFQFVSHCLNVLGYKGRRNWNMVYLAMELMGYARYVNAAAWLKSWLPFLVLLPLAVVYGGAAALTTWASLGGALLLLIFTYSFLVADPARLLYLTPQMLDATRAARV